VSPDPSLDLPPFRPRFPWWGGDLQTIANRLLGVSTDLAPHTSERLAFAMPDGSGDTLLASLDRPATARPGTPLAILIHGLTGSQDSLYIVSMARLLLDRGWRVLRLNLRGAGPSRALCGQHYYAGRSQDFRLLLSLLPGELTRDGMVAVGYSLGGAMLLKYLGEEGAASPLRAAATVCAPIDLAVTCRYMMRPRNLFYHGYILDLMKVEATGEGAIVSPEERAAILRSRTVWDYDDFFIAPRYGLPVPRTITTAAGRPASWARCARPRWWWRQPTIPGCLASSIGRMIGRQTGRSRRFCPTMAAMSASMARAAASRGATSWWRGSWNMGEIEPMALIVGVACSLVALVLAWRAYRGASEEQERRKRERERDGRP
jgi:predicted alpha/beta-fold hydrolase